MRVKTKLPALFQGLIRQWRRRGRVVFSAVTVSGTIAATPAVDSAVRKSRRDVMLYGLSGVSEKCVRTQFQSKIT